MLYKETRDKQVTIKKQYFLTSRRADTAWSKPAQSSALPASSPS